MSAVGTVRTSLPRISVITVCRNAAATLEKTVQSVLWQDYADLEYVVIDGLSTDGTMGVLESYREHVDILLHESDRGIYDAMNKGIRVSTGDVLAFINADDCFVTPYTCSRMARAFADHPSVDIAYGDSIWDSGSEMRQFAQRDRVDRKFFLLVNPSIMHQSMFCRRRAFERVGLFDDKNFRVAADKDWNIRAFLVAGLDYLHVPVVVSLSAHGGYSTTARDRLEFEKEIIKRKYFRWDERLYYGAAHFWARVDRRVRTRDLSLPLALRWRLPGFPGKKKNP